MIKVRFASIVCDQCWPWLPWRLVARADWAGKKAESGARRAARKQARAPACVNVKPQSLALSVPHYVTEPLKNTVLIDLLAFCTSQET